MKITPNKKVSSLLVLLLSIISIKAQTWNQVGTGSESPITCFTEFNGKLYVGGFGHIGFTSSGVASWDGVQWSPLGDSINPGFGIKAVAVYNNELIVAGNFPDINFISNTQNIAAWDGTSWHSLGTGINSAVGDVHDLKVFNGDLYAGGNFTNVGGINCSKIARWDGTSWHKVQSGVNGTVYSLCIYNNQLYVGGNFFSAGGLPVNSIARWDGANWDSVSVGVNGYVFNMTVDSLHNHLIIGGNFANVDTNYGLCICGWDGNQILPIGNGLPNVVSAMCFYNNVLIVNQPPSSKFDTMLLYWDSVSWKPILGHNQIINTLITYKNEVYAGGDFDTIGVLPFAYIARYSNPTLGINEDKFESGYLRVFPNPSNGKITIQYKLQSGALAENIKIYDYGGKLVKTIKIKDSGGTVIYAEGVLPKGVYLAKIENKRENLTTKFVIE